MRKIFPILFASGVLVGIAVAQPAPLLPVEPPTQPAAPAAAPAPDGGGGQADLGELVKEVARLRAAKAKGDGAEWRMAIAALVAFVLKWVVSGLKKLKTEELTDRAKHAIPWVIAALGVVVAVAAHYGMGESWTNAVILGGGPPGAVLFHNLWEAFVGLLKKKPGDGANAAGGAALALLFVVAAALSGCCTQLRDAVARHERADTMSAQVIKGATARIRQADCDEACRAASLKVIDAQADAVPASGPAVPRVQP